MVKRIDKPFLNESIEWMATEDRPKDRIQERLLWQHIVNTAIKKRLISHGSAKPRMVIN